MSFPAVTAWIAISLVVTAIFGIYFALRSSRRAPDGAPGGAAGPYASPPLPQARRAPSASTLALLGLIVSVLSLISSTVIGLLEVLKK